MKPSSNQIPDPLWEEMVDFYGYEKAYKMAKIHINSFRALTIQLFIDKLSERLAILFGKEK